MTRRRGPSNQRTPKSGAWKQRGHTPQDGQTAETNIPKSYAGEDDQSMSSQLDSADASTPSNKVGTENVPQANSSFQQALRSDKAEDLQANTLEISNESVSDTQLAAPQLGPVLDSATLTLPHSSGNPVVETDPVQPELGHVEVHLEQGSNTEARTEANPVGQAQEESQEKVPTELLGDGRTEINNETKSSEDQVEASKAGSIESLQDKGKLNVGDEVTAKGEEAQILTPKLQSTQDEVAAMQRKFEDLLLAKESLEKEYGASLTREQVLTAQLEKIQEESTTMACQLKEATESLHSTRAQLGSMGGELEQARVAASDALSASKKFEEEKLRLVAVQFFDKTSLAQDLAQMTEARDKLQESEARANAEAAELSGRLAALSGEKERVESTNASLTSSLESTRKELDLKNNELEKATQEKKEQEGVIADLTTELKVVKEKYENFELEASPKVQKLQMLERELDEQTSKHQKFENALREELELLGAEKRRADEQIAQLQGQQASMEATQRQLESELAVARAENITQREDCGRLSTALSEQEEAMKRMIEDFNRTRQEGQEAMQKELEDRVKDQAARFAEEKRKLERLYQDSVADADLVKAKYAEASDEMRALRESLSTKTIEVERLRDECKATVDASVQRLSRVEADLAQKDDNLNRLSSEYNAVVAESRELEKRIAGLTRELESAAATKQKDEESLNNLSSDLMRLENAHKQVLEENRQKDNTIVEKSREAEVLVNRASKMTERVQELEAHTRALQQELDRAEEHLLAAEKVQKRLSEMEALTADCEELQKRLSAATGALHNAEAEIEGRMDTEERLRAELNEWKEKHELLVQLLDERRRRNLLQRVFNIE